MTARAWSLALGMAGALHVGLGLLPARSQATEAAPRPILHLELSAPAAPPPEVPAEPAPPPEVPAEPAPPARVKAPAPDRDPAGARRRMPPSVRGPGPRPVPEPGPEAPGPEATGPEAPGPEAEAPLEVVPASKAGPPSSEVSQHEVTAPVPAAPAPDAARVADLGPSRQRMLKAINRMRRYPRRARLLRQQGLVRVQVNLTAGGQLLEPPAILQTSGHRLLDEEALRMVGAAAPYAPLPAGHTSARFELPIRFVLR